MLVVDPFGIDFGPKSAKRLKETLGELGYGSAKVEAGGLDRDLDIREKIANAHGVVHLFSDERRFRDDIAKIKANMTDGKLLSLSDRPTDLEYSRIAKEIIQHYEGLTARK